MIRGTTYAAVEIAIWMAISAALGFAIAWVLRSWLVRRKVSAEWGERFDAEHQRARSLEKELTEVQARAADLETNLATLRGRRLDLVSCAGLRI